MLYLLTHLKDRTAMRVVVTIAIFMGITGCSPASNSSSTNQDDTDLVYFAVLEELFALQDDDNKKPRSENVIVVNSTTGLGPDGNNPEYGKDMLSSFENLVTSELIEGLEAENARTKTFMIADTPDVKVIMLDPEQRSTIFNNDKESWNVFYEKFPGALGLLTFSVPAFDKSRQKALVYCASMSGFLAGSGSFFLLEKNKQSWQVVQTVPAWIS